MVDYLVLKWVHILGGILLLGNVTVTGVWSLYLYRHWRDEGMPFAPIARAILLTDLVFTLGGGALLSITGVWMALRSGFPFLGTPWLLHGIIALSLATLAWAVVLIPDQLKMEKATDPAQIRKLFLRWSVIGWADTAVLFYGLWAMVTKS